MEVQGSNIHFPEGCKLYFKTCFGLEVRGRVVAFEPVSNLIMIHLNQEDLSGPGPIMHTGVYNASHIVEYTILGQYEDPLDANNSLIDVDDSLQAKEESSIRREELEAERVGVGVTIEAQSSRDTANLHDLEGEDPLDGKNCLIDFSNLLAEEEQAELELEMEMERLVVGFTAEAEMIYDALSKTLPVRWDGTVIVVMNEVRVVSPYTPESVLGGTATANEQVRRVLEVERQRLQIR